MSNKIHYSYQEAVGNCYYLHDVEYEPRKMRKAMFLCKCGNTFIAPINSVKQLVKKSCGCLPTCCSPVHGGWGSRLYSIWNGMKDRCNNKNSTVYPLYGGKGITYDPDWELFPNFQKWAFANGYSDHLSIDRIDPNKNYCPENCRWSDEFTQAQNRNMNKNNSSGYKGVSYCKQTDTYKASIGYFNKQKTLGRFATAKEAAIAYNTFVTENNLNHRLNDVQ